MANVHQRIARLRVRLKGVDAATARAVGDGLGEAIAASLSPGLPRPAAQGYVRAMQLGSVTLPAGADASTVRHAAASAVGRALIKDARSQEAPS